MSLNGAKKAEFLMQFLKTFSCEIASGEVNEFDVKLLEACVQLLKTVKHQLKEKSELPALSAIPEAPPIHHTPMPAPLPPPMPTALLSKRVEKVAKIPEKTPLKTQSLASHQQTLIETLNTVKRSLTDGDDPNQPLTALRQNRLDGIEAIEGKRRAFFIQRAKDRANPEACSEFSLQLLKDVVHTRKNLQKKTELELVLEREARWEKTAQSLAKYEERQLQKQREALSKEIDELILSFVEVQIEIEPKAMEDLTASFVSIELPDQPVVDELTRSMMAMDIRSSQSQPKPHYPT